jgi:hypothetical protein
VRPPRRLPHWLQQFVGKASAVGLALAVVWWAVEAALHAFIFDHDTYWDAVTNGTANELWMRVLTAVLFVTMGCLVQRNLFQLRKAQARDTADKP